MRRICTARLADSGSASHEHTTTARHARESISHARGACTVKDGASADTTGTAADKTGKAADKDSTGRVSRRRFPPSPSSW
eukprot:708899-Rhodomonas_salina.1